MPICVFLTVLKVPESKDYVQSNISPIKGFKIMLENSPFKRLIMAFMFGGIAFSITIPLYLFFITYVLKAEEMAIFMLTFFYLTNITFTQKKIKGMCKRNHCKTINICLMLSDLL